MADLDLTAEQQARAIAEAAAERAARLATMRAAKAQEIAVARAVRDANVDHDLREHDRHLRAINGSQEEMARSLAALEASFGEMTTAQTAVAQYVERQARGQFSKRTLWIAGLGAGATWLAIIATLLTTVF